jgi:signal transduction histidine kinase
VRRGWAKLGLRGRLAISIGAIVVVAFAAVFVLVRADMADESRLIRHEESREAGHPGGASGESGEGSAISPIADAQDEVERTFLIAGGAALLAALLAGYLVAARTAAPLRRIASTAATVDAGDLTPRLRPEASTPELRTVVEAFNHMLDRLDLAFSRQRRFVSDASHELRTPLTAIRGQLEVLARKEAPSAGDVRRAEALAMTEIHRVERLVDDLLALAQLDEGTEPLLHDVEAAPLLRGLAEASFEQTEIGELAEGSVPIDSDLIAQVVRNLLSNAHRHAGPDGRVVLSARAERGRLVVAVDDDGPGVPAERREQVFERFHRNQPARDRSSGGSGLGLGIARSIVDLHGGHIWIDDSPLGGACAAFSLPGFRPQMRDLSPGA